MFIVEFGSLSSKCFSYQQQMIKAMVLCLSDGLLLELLL